MGKRRKCVKINNIDLTQHNEKAFKKPSVSKCNYFQLKWCPTNMNYSQD